jgi:imidazole glycerol-phosphate synthase subunit HisH
MISILNLRMGNVGSVKKMLDFLGAESRIESNPEGILHSSGVVIPGVGAFDSGMRAIRSYGFEDVLTSKAQSGTPILGICLGMQLLGDFSDEGTSKGLGLVRGITRKFNFGSNYNKLKIPHMGWNTVKVINPHVISDNIGADARFYFVHSYHFDCKDPEDKLFVTPYGHDFVSGIAHENIVGVQFHPEKSHKFGIQIFRNFVNMCLCSDKE